MKIIVDANIDAAVEYGYTFSGSVVPLKINTVSDWSGKLFPFLIFLVCHSFLCLQASVPTLNGFNARRLMSIQL